MKPDHKIEVLLKYETAQLDDLVPEKTDELQRNIERLRETLAGTICALAVTVETREPNIPPAINSECPSWPVLLLNAWTFQRNNLKGFA